VQVTHAEADAAYRLQCESTQISGAEAGGWRPWVKLPVIWQTETYITRAVRLFGFRLQAVLRAECASTFFQ